jgi:hypothetical protein
MPAQRFPFAFTTAYRIAAAPFGVTPGRAFVLVDPGADLLLAKYGPWQVKTALSNVTGAQLTGPYGTLRTIGPAHLSFADHGMTMASNPDRGVCISSPNRWPGSSRLVGCATRGSL